MRFLIDHNINQQAPAALKSIYQKHDFVHAFSLGLHTMKDEDLFAHLGAEGFDAIITKDKRQLVNPDERAGLRAAGLHWIGYKAKGIPGLLGIALETSTIVSGLPFVLQNLQPVPTQFTLMGIASEQNQRMKSVPI